MEILLISKRANDGKVSEQRKSIDQEKIKAFIEGCDIILKTRLILGYCIKDVVTNEVLVRKGKI